MTKFDTWLTNQPEEPVYFDFNPTGLNYEWSLEHTEIDGSCTNCGANIGINSDCGVAISYWQIDIDAEHLLCDDCYTKITEEA